MRTIAIILLVLFAGCSGRPTLEELEDHAMVTGDWSEVEKRERQLARAATLGVEEHCPANSTRVCIEKGMDSDCQCMSGAQSPSTDYKEPMR